MAESINKEISDIPPNADKMRFADDLVDYTFTQYFPLFKYCKHWRSANDVAQFRLLTYKGFNEKILRAVYNIVKVKKRSIEEYFERLKRRKDPCSYTFAMLIKHLETKYFIDGFNYLDFIIYSVKLSMFAVLFYTDGKFDALKEAKTRIITVLRDIDMKAGGWEALHSTAEKFDDLVDAALEITRRNANLLRMKPELRQSFMSWII